MVKTNIAITTHEDKTSKNNKDYTRFNTNMGWMSCFEKDVIAKCKDNEGKVICVETAESVKDGRTFNNIRGFYEVVAGAGVVEPQGVEVVSPQKFVDPSIAQSNMKQDLNNNIQGNFPARKSVKGSAYEKDPVGLAVEVFNEIIKCDRETGHSFEQIVWEDWMDKATNLVKQAQKAFS